jgi:hypothetical protein
LCDYITHLKKSGIIAPSSVQFYVAALHKFYVMNDMTSLNWKKDSLFHRRDCEADRGQTLYSFRDSATTTEDYTQKPSDYLAYVFRRAEGWSFIAEDS